MKKWKKDEILTLNENYTFGDNEKIKKLLPNRTWPAIKEMAHRLNLKIEYKTKAEFLLDESLESFYWSGFLLADGYIDNGVISLSLSIKDVNHLMKFCNKINSNWQKRIQNKNNIFGRECDTKKFEMVYTRVRNKIVVKKIIDKFDIKQKKTYNPPDFSKYNFSDEQMLSLIIGFIDGDGCISRSKTCNSSRITIGIHISWKNNLEFILMFLQKFFNMTCKSKIREVIFNNGKKNHFLSRIEISKPEILKPLKQFALQHDLPILERKWNNIIF